MTSTERAPCQCIRCVLSVEREVVDLVLTSMKLWSYTWQTVPVETPDPVPVYGGERVVSHPAIVTMGLSSPGSPKQEVICTGFAPEFLQPVLTRVAARLADTHRSASEERDKPFMISRDGRYAMFVEVKWQDESERAGWTGLAERVLEERHKERGSVVPWVRPEFEQLLISDHHGRFDHEQHVSPRVRASALRPGQPSKCGRPRACTELVGKGTE